MRNFSFEEKIILGTIVFCILLVIFAGAIYYKVRNNHIRSGHTQVWSVVNQDWIWVDKDNKP